VVLSLAEPHHLDPRYPEDLLGASLGRLAFQGLLDSDPRTLLPRKALARSVTYPTPRTVRVTLRDDATFSDGARVTAQDVVATYRSILDPSTTSRLRGTYAQTFHAVDALDDGTVEFTLERQDGTVEVLLQQPIVRAAEALPQELLASPQNARRFLGAGPVVVQSLERGDWTFRRRLARAGAPTRVRVLSLRDPNTLALRLLHGEGDAAELKPELYPVFDTDPRFRVVSAPSVGLTHLGMRCEHPLLRDVRVRRAIAHALDREGLRQSRFGSRAVGATGPLPPHHWAYNPAVARYPYDPARARALLDEAGLRPGEDGVRARFVLRVSSLRFAVTLGRALAAMLDAVGIAVEVRPSELATLLADVRAGRFELTLLTIPDLSDPMGLAFWFHSDSIPRAGARSAGGNRWRFRNEALDRALDAGARALGPEARRPPYAEAQRLLAEALPVIPLWHADVVWVAARRLGPFVPRGDGGLEFLLDLGEGVMGLPGPAP
jgi:peptide/nickel transport system substrate-binding protein